MSLQRPRLDSLLCFHPFVGHQYEPSSVDLEHRLSWLFLSSEKRHIWLGSGFIALCVAIVRQTELSEHRENIINILDRS